MGLTPILGTNGSASSEHTMFFSLRAQEGEPVRESLFGKPGSAGKRREPGRCPGSLLVPTGVRGLRLDVLEHGPVDDSLRVVG
jgi:hypothetical protein